MALRPNQRPGVVDAEAVAAVVQGDQRRAPNRPPASNHKLSRRNSGGGGGQAGVPSQLSYRNILVKDRAQSTASEEEAVCLKSGAQQQQEQVVTGGGRAEACPPPWVSLKDRPSSIPLMPVGAFFAAIFFSWSIAVLY